MPPHGGSSTGLERFTARMLELPNVKEATAFPRDMNRIDVRFPTDHGKSFALRRTAIFQGPLEALLDLIEARKMSVSDISLRGVTDAYLAYVEKLPSCRSEKPRSSSWSPRHLLLIKSRALLPSLELSDEERETVEELNVVLPACAHSEGCQTAAQTMGKRVSGACVARPHAESRASRRMQVSQLSTLR